MMHTALLAASVGASLQLAAGGVTGTGRGSS